MRGTRRKHSANRRLPTVPLTLSRGGERGPDPSPMPPLMRPSLLGLRAVDLDLDGAGVAAARFGDLEAKAGRRQVGLEIVHR